MPERPRLERIFSGLATRGGPPIRRCLSVPIDLRLLRGQAGPMEDESDPISIDDIHTLREMSERLGEAVMLAESCGTEQLVELLRRTKAWVDDTLARNPSSERN